ncbi:hypothetical protein [Bradyrhizobium elkanii]|uniref:hypothetical protein n=1 Tax=Bradyrhizobium elkanii TaxID=29448 RepID=UPI001BA9E814|nr:hypothetical protein [Bradyrhizobium elkanii]MBR1163072.1 hypothetical protein [Bradyrhizobium elkanii]
MPDVDTLLVDGSSDNLIFELANSAIDISLMVRSAALRTKGEAGDLLWSGVVAAGRQEKRHALRHVRADVRPQCLWIFAEHRPHNSGAITSSRKNWGVLVTRSEVKMAEGHAVLRA